MIKLIQNRLINIIIFYALFFLLSGCGSIMMEILESSEDKKRVRQSEKKLNLDRCDQSNNIEVIHHTSWKDGVSEHIYINGKDIASVLKQYFIMKGGFDIKAQSIYIGKLAPGFYIIEFYRQDRWANKDYYDFKRVIIDNSNKKQTIEFGSSSGLISTSFKESINDMNREYGSNASRDILKISGIDPKHDLSYYQKYVDELYYKKLINSTLMKKKIKTINDYFELFTGNKITAEQLYDYCNNIINDYSH